MIGTSFIRITRAALQNFWRNIWLSMATTVIMTLTLLMVSFLYFANIFGNEILQSFEQKVDLNVTFNENVQSDYIEAISKELATRPDVADVRIVSSEEALRIFRERHEDDPLIEESLQELESNPLPASIYITATEPRHYTTITAHLESDTYSPFIDTINFESTRVVIDKLINLITSIKNISLIITILFAILVILIMYNTIRLAIYSFREEIEIMRLVGASRWFVQGPFIMEGIIVAVLGVTISTLIVYPSLKTTAPHLQRFFLDSQGEQFNIYTFATTHWPQLIGLQLVIAISLAVFSSFFAIRRYLRD